MERRNFIRTTTALSAASCLPLATTLSAPRAAESALIKPKKLNEGDTIGLVTPASALPRTSFDLAIENITSLGFKAKYSPNLRVKKGFLGGTDQQRLDDIHSMFESPEVSGIVCARGGYGAGRLLPHINYDLIKANPKVFVGYSDITALLYGIHKMSGLVCFHGPMAASVFSDFTKKSFKETLTQKESPIKILIPSYGANHEKPAFQPIRLFEGRARGALVGGNLSLVCAMLGTPYDLDFKDKIVFLEEVGENPYRIDRMLTQLLNAGKLQQAKGIALGVFYDCQTAPTDPSYPWSTGLKSVLMDRIAPLKIPAIYGMPIGHIEDNATLPFGVQAQLDTTAGSLSLLAPAVV